MPDSKEPLERFSFSQMDTYLRCSKRYELERVMQAPTIPLMAGVGGTAVHRTVEEYIRKVLEQS